MIKKLKMRFVLICMSSILFVLGAIIATVNIINYRFINQTADELLDLLAYNDGMFIEEYFKEYGAPPYTTKESKYETRFFCVRFDDEERLISINIQNIASVNEEEAVSYAFNVLNSNKKRGFYEKYRYLISKTTNGKLVIFVDCSKAVYIARKFVNISVIVGAFALVGLSLLVWTISSKTVKPIVDSYNKQRKFITDAGHELKTPLTIIAANAEIMEIENGEDECIDAIKKQVARMTQMTKNLVTLSRIDEADLRNEMNEFSLTNTSIDIFESMKKVAINQGKEYTYSAENDLIYNGNERLIRELLLVIVDNAIKYSKSHININVSKKKNKLIVDIENDTNGLNKDEIKNYTNRFYRTDESRASSIEGSGIGLSIANEIVKMHKGEMKLSSEDGIEFKIKIIL